MCWSHFLIELQASLKAYYNFIKKRPQHRYFPVNIEKLRPATLLIRHFNAGVFTREIFKNSLFYRTPLVAVSGYCLSS